MIEIEGGAEVYFLASCLGEVGQVWGVGWQKDIMQMRTVDGSRPVPILPVQLWDVRNWFRDRRVCWESHLERCILHSRIILPSIRKSASVVAVSTAWRRCCPGKSHLPIAKTFQCSTGFGRNCRNIFCRLLSLHVRPETTRSMFGREHGESNKAMARWAWVSKARESFRVRHPCRVTSTSSHVSITLSLLFTFHINLLGSIIVRLDSCRRDTVLPNVAGFRLSLSIRTRYLHLRPAAAPSSHSRVSDF